jgi:hypothetical protein
MLEAGLKAIGMTDLNLSCDVRKATDVPGGLVPGLAGRSQTLNIII